MSAGDAERFIARNVNDRRNLTDEEHRKYMVELGDKLRREGYLSGKEATDYRRVGARNVYEHYLTASLPNGSPLPVIHSGPRESCSTCSQVNY